MKRFLIAAAAAGLILTGCDFHTTAEHCATIHTEEGKDESVTLVDSDRTSLGDYCEFSDGTSYRMYDLTTEDYEEL